MTHDEAFTRLLGKATWIGSPAGVRTALAVAVAMTVVGGFLVWWLRDWTGLLSIVTGWLLYVNARLVQSRRKRLLGKRLDAA